MRDENYTNSIFYHDHDGGIYTAASLWCMDAATAKARYGPIALWDTKCGWCIEYMYRGSADWHCCYGAHVWTLAFSILRPQI